MAGRSTGSHASAKSSKHGDQHSGNRCSPATVAAGLPVLLHEDVLAKTWTLVHMHQKHDGEAMVILVFM